MEFEHKVGAFDDEGLVVNDKEKKNWKGIVISLLVIGSIMGAIIVSIILSTPGEFILNIFWPSFKAQVSISKTNIKTQITKTATLTRTN